MVVGLCGGVPLEMLGRRGMATAARSFAVREDLRMRQHAAPKAPFPVRNPATGDVLAVVADMPADDARRAVRRAEAALPQWGCTSARERSAALRRWHDSIMAEKEYLAELMTAEQGKPLAEAHGEVVYGASFLSWFAEEAKRIDGDLIQNAGSTQRIVVMHQPVGICSLITPWNFPLAMITRKAGAALAAGCTVVIKPSEDTPLTAEALVALAAEAGLPEGVIELVTCSRDGVSEVGHELATNEAIRKVSFTGSTSVGKTLTELAAGTMKRVSMELGGNAPFIVFDDADIDAAVAGAMASKFRNSGQTCVCANRFFVHSSIHDEFVSKFQTAVEQLVVGDGAEDGTTQGPLINPAAVAKVEALVDHAVDAGAKVVTGGKRHATGPNFYAPTLVTEVTDDMRLAQEEIFGPVAPVLRFETDDEVVARANATSAGLAGYFYSQNMARLWRVAERLQYGMVGANSGIISTEVAPFGGVKESGTGREGSKYGIKEYLDTKYVLMDIGN